MTVQKPLTVSASTMASFSPESDSFDDLFEDSGEFSQLAAHFPTS